MCGRLSLFAAESVVTDRFDAARSGGDATSRRTRTTPSSSTRTRRTGGSTATDASATALLDPYPAAAMCAYPVSTDLGNPANDSPEPVEEVVPESEAQSGLGDFG